MPARSFTVIVCLGFFSAIGCYDAPPVETPIPDREMFGNEVYPVLLRDCGFPACHGDEGRFFRVFGPGRTRLDPDNVLISEPVLAAEIDASYERARSMLASAHSAEETLLVRKPLEVDAGGAPHLGLGERVQDVYSSVDDPSYQLLLSWARSGLPEE